MTNTFKGNSLIYIPVTTSLSDTKKKYPFTNKFSTNSKQLSWWSNDPFFSYNAMLVSAYYGIDRVKNRSTIRDDVLFFGDSGGYQILQHLGKKKEPDILKKLSWKKVVEWQMSVCDVGMTLDIPTPRKWNQFKDRKIFEDRLNKSTSNALAMLDYKNKHIDEAYNPDFKLFNCIHGSFYEDMNRWYDVTTNHRDCEYDGFSFSNSKMRYILALRLGFAIEHSKGKPFHILGTSSPQSLALVAYANKYTKTQIYFDSSSAATGKTLRKFMLFWDFSGNGLTYKENPDHTNFHTWVCPCPICSHLETPEDLWNNKSKSGSLLTLHNLFWMEYYIYFISNIVHYEDEFKAYIKKITRDNSSWIFRYIEFLDLVNEYDLETTWNIYFNRNKPKDLFLENELNNEYCDTLVLNADYNSKIKKLHKNSFSFAVNTCKDLMNKDIMDPLTHDMVKFEESFEKELTEVFKSSVKICKRSKLKKVKW